MDNIKKFVAGFKKVVNKILNTLKKLTTTVGQIIALAIILVFVVIVAYIVVEGIGIGLKMSIGGDESAGISSDADYEYIISSFSDAGYDSLLTEKTYQEFLSYEYSVLMDVADYLFKIQKQKGSILLQGISVKADYNIGNTDEATWRQRVISGQNSARYENTGFLSNIPAGTNDDSLGSNMDVLPPRIVYEFRNSSVSGEKIGSLVPYIYVLKEDITYNYYSVGAATSDGVTEPDGGRANYGEGGKYASNIWNSGVLIDAGNISDINLLEFNMLLNGNNSCFTHSLTRKKKATSTHDDKIPADGKYDPALYSHDEYGATMYKIPLKLLIDRYLPKSILLSQWYLLKDKRDLNYIGGNQTPATAGDGEADLFAVDELIKDIKRIYNYYCWNGEGLSGETVESVVYDEFGAVKRGEDGKAELSTETKFFDGTNNKTFIHFGTVGLESNRFGVFTAYKPSNPLKGPVNPQGTNDLSKATMPIVTNLLSKTGYFLDNFTVRVEYDYEYAYTYQIAGELNRSYEVWPSSWGSLKDTESGPFRNYRPDQLEELYEQCNSSSNRHSYLDRKYITKNGVRYAVIKYDSADQIAYYYSMSPSTVNESGEIVSDPVNITQRATGYTEIEYNRGDNYDQSGLDDISKLLTKGIEYGHTLMQNNSTVTPISQSYSQEHTESQLINYMYYPDSEVFPDGAGTTMYAGAADVLTVGYKHDIPIYYFGFSGESNDMQKNLSVNIADGIKQLYDEGRFTQIVEQRVPLGSGDFPNPKPTINLPSSPDSSILPVDPDWELTPNSVHYSGDPSYQGITRITGVSIKLVNTDTGEAVALDDIKNLTQDEIKNIFIFGSGFEHDIAAHIVKEEIIALTMDVPQQRMPALLVTDAQTWAKDLTCDINVTQNIFKSDNYRYVVPHAWAGFGVRELNVEEKPKYRVDYYKDYFSQYGNQEPRIKEADILEMMIEWEKLGMKGEESAYVMMRDLYKLIMCIRDSGAILGQNYSYLYIPETIWNFREGITQEAFWTERLASRGDPLTAEEQKKIIVKKNEISWQVVDYANYAECNNNINPATGEAITSLYALFPQGSPYLRTLYQEHAVATGLFPDGSFAEGHGGADWSSRGKMKDLLNSENAPEAGDVYRKLYEYDLLCRTLREILSASTGSENKMTELRNAIDLNSLKLNSSYKSTGNDAYNRARNSLRAELEELSRKSPIVSVAPGYVSVSRYNCYGGFSVHVIHSSASDDGRVVKTTYGHMKRWPEVQQGDYVGAGTILGYEGTTGNSGGHHLHMGVKINDVAESPAKYMGPIYTPFYNADKVDEERTNYESFISALGDKVLLGSDYLSLIRTVLMARFENNKLKTGPISGIDPEALSLAKSKVVTIGASKYLQFSEVIPISDPTNNSVSNKIVIANLGEPEEPEYWKFELEEEVISVTTGDPQPLYDPTTGDLITSTHSANNNIVKYKIKTSNKVDDIASELSNLGSGVRVKVARQPDRYEIKEINWGVTVPIYPLFENYADAISMDVLTIPKKFEVNKADYEGYSTDQDMKNYNSPYGDVRVTKDAFDITSEYARAHRELNHEDPIVVDMATYLTDVDNDTCVPLYDGPVSKEIYEAYVGGSYPGYLGNYYCGTSTPPDRRLDFAIGLPGTQFYDLERMQQILLAFGLAKDAGESRFEVGVYNDAMVETVKSLNDTMLSGQTQDNLASPHGWLGGVPGEIDPGNNIKWFDVTVTTAWDMEMVYHSEPLAKAAGRRSEEIGATRNSFPIPILRGIGNCESFDIPLMESYAFLSNAEYLNFEDPAHIADEKKAIIHYNLPAGKFRAIRRAQGLCAFSWGTAKERCTKHGITDDYEILLKVRTGIFNAIYAGEIIHENICTILSNKERKDYQNAINDNGFPGEGLLDWAKEVARRNPHWQKLGEDMGVNPTQLVVWSAAICMYRGGPNVIADADYRQAGHRVSWGFENMVYYPDGTDRFGRPGVIDLHSDQTGYTGTVLKVMYNEYINERERVTGQTWTATNNCKGGYRLADGSRAPYDAKESECYIYDVNGNLHPLATLKASYRDEELGITGPLYSDAFNTF